MIDNIAILFSCVTLIFVVVRAIQLDSRLPWFGSGPAGGAVARKARRRGA